MKPLYKTTVVIWSATPGDTQELSTLATAAESGDAYCSRFRSEHIADPAEDPDWDDNDVCEEIFPLLNEED